MAGVDCAHQAISSHCYSSKFILYELIGFPANCVLRKELGKRCAHLWTTSWTCYCVPWKRCINGSVLMDVLSLSRSLHCQKCLQRNAFWRKVFSVERGNAGKEKTNTWFTLHEKLPRSYLPLNCVRLQNWTIYYLIWPSLRARWTSIKDKLYCLQ